MYYIYMVDLMMKYLKKEVSMNIMNISMKVEIA